MSRAQSCGPNPLNPNLMTPAERRTDLCRILALGLFRLRVGDADQLSAKHGEFPLHNSAVQRAHATPTNRRTA